jgi:hypothetical protein
VVHRAAEVQRCRGTEEVQQRRYRGCTEDVQRMCRGCAEAQWWCRAGAGEQSEVQVLLQHLLLNLNYLKFLDDVRQPGLKHSNKQSPHTEEVEVERATWWCCCGGWRNVEAGCWREQEVKY